MTNNELMERYIAEYKNATEEFKQEQKRISDEVMGAQALYLTNEFGAAYFLKIDKLQMSATKIKTMANMVMDLMQTFNNADQQQYYVQLQEIYKLLQ